MAIDLKRIGWWLLGAGFVLAPFADQVFVTLRTATYQRPVDDVDPQLRWIGSVGTVFETVADAVQPQRTFRDVEFYLGDAGMVEIVARALGPSFEVALFDRTDHQTAVITVPENGQATLHGQAHRGPMNRVRVRRSRADATASPFELKIRAMPR